MHGLTVVRLYRHDPCQVRQVRFGYQRGAALRMQHEAVVQALLRV